MNKEDYVHKDILTATDYVELNKNNELLMIYNQALLKENQELKKQLEENKDKINWYENFEINKTIDELRIKHNNQQKEFIGWLEAMSKMYENEYKDIDIAGHYNCVLAKYKEIIGE